MLLWTTCDIFCQNYFCDSICIAKGDSCMQQYDTFRAIVYFKQCQMADKDVNIIRKIAECYRKAGNYINCIFWLHKIESAEISHKDMRSLYYSYKSLGKKDSLLYWGTRITSLFPSDCEIIASLSAYYNDQNNYIKADSLARAYCKIDSTNMQVKRQLGFACYSQKKYDEAAEIYQRLIFDGFDNYESNYIVGICYEQMDSLELAYKHLSMAVKFSESKDFNSLYRLGVICLNLGSATESLEYLKKADNVIQLDRRTMYNLYKNMGASYFKLRKYEEAGQAFEDCLKYCPENDLAYYNAAQMFYAAGEKEKAKKYLCIFIERMEQKSDFTDQTIQIIETAKQQRKKW